MELQPLKRTSSVFVETQAFASATRIFLLSLKPVLTKEDIFLNKRETGSARATAKSAMARNEVLMLFTISFYYFLIITINTKL